MAVGRLSLAAIGDNCIDSYLPPVGVSAVGGQALNVAVTWSRLGWNSEYLGAVGNDADGVRVLGALRTEGVGTDLVQVHDSPTGLTQFSISSTGDRVVEFEDQGACAEYAPEASELDRLSEFDHVHMAQLCDFRSVAAALKERGLSVSYDFSTELETTDLFGVGTAIYSWPGKPDDQGLASLANAAFKGGALVVVATCGEHGSAVFQEGKRTIESVREIRPVDTCGAGDAFAAVFLSERLRGQPVQVSMSAAAEAASKACLHLGAWEQSLVNLDEVRQ